MEYYLKIHFIVDEHHYYTRGTAPCTEKAFQNGEFSERYIINCVYSLISGYMEVKRLEGNPKLIDWSFDSVNS